MRGSRRPLMRLRQFDQHDRTSFTVSSWYQFKSIAVTNFRILKDLLANDKSIVFEIHIGDDLLIQNDTVEIKYYKEGLALIELQEIPMKFDSDNYPMPIDLFNKYYLNENPQLTAMSLNTTSAMRQRLDELKKRHEIIGLTHIFEREFGQIIDEMNMLSSEQLHAVYFHGYHIEVFF